MSKRTQQEQQKPRHNVRKEDEEVNRRLEEAIARLDDAVQKLLSGNANEGNTGGART